MSNDTKLTDSSQSGTSPFREGSVPLVVYQEMENKLNKSIEDIKVKRDILDNQNKDLREKVSNLEERISKNRNRNLYYFLRLIISGAVILGFSVKGVACAYTRCNRDSPGGEAAFLNAENSLRRHLTGMRYTIHALSCRETGGSIGDTNNDIDSDYRFCQVIYSTHSNPSVQIQAAFVCDSAYAELSDGCRERKISETPIEGGIFRDR